MAMAADAIEQDAGESNDQNVNSSRDKLSNDLINEVILAWQALVALVDPAIRAVMRRGRLAKATTYLSQAL